MKAKLFDAHNKFLQDYDTPEASPTLQIALEPSPNPAAFRLVDTDESGALIYREVDQ